MRLRLIVPLALVVAAFAASGSALPSTCADPCTIFASTPAFIPGGASIASGTSVVFESIDISHPTGESMAGMDTCFIASTGAGNPAPPVTFTWDGATMRADGTECTTATTLPTGEGVLVFQCLLHPHMLGVLTVS